VAAIAAWRLRRERDVRFALAWIVPFWIALELVPTKLPHYVLPCLPAIAVLLAEALTTHGRMVADDAKVARTIGVIAALSLPLAWTTAVAWASMKGLLAVSVAAIFSIAVTFAIAGLLVNATLIRERGTLIVIGAALYLALVMGLVLPGAGRLDTAGQLHAAIRSVDPDAPVALVGYHEPSAVFALGTDTLLTDPAGAAAFILDRPGAIAGIATVDFGAAQQAAATRGGNLVPIVTVSGYNYAKESMVELVVVKGAP
jgi:4-amino-4-deoxy-L-arabinose transferase-like glycosyltransferase